MPGDKIDPMLAYQTLARILSMQTGLEVSVEVTKKPPHDATERGKNNAKDKD